MARIVVIEPDARVLRAMVKALGSRGHEVVATIDAAAAVKALRTLPAELLVVGAPGEDAVEIIQLVRANLPAISIVLLSDPAAHVAATFLPPIEAAQRVWELRKPIRKVPFLDVVRTALAGRRPPRIPRRVRTPGRQTTSRTSRQTLGKKLTIVVVEPDAPLCHEIRRTIEKIGPNVFEAPDGFMGLALCRRYRPAVAIVEIVVPGKDGLTLIGEIRMHSPRTKIIATSSGDADSSDDSLPIAWIYGASRSFRKPYRLPDLLAAVSDLLSEPSTSAPPKEPWRDKPPRRTP